MLFARDVEDCVEWVKGRRGGAVVRGEGGE